MLGGNKKFDPENGFSVPKLDKDHRNLNLTKAD